MQKTFIALTLAIASTAALADGFYVGADAGTTHSTQLASGGTVGAFAGYEWNHNIAAELGYEQFPGLVGANGGHAHAVKLDGVATTYFDKAQTFGLFGFAGINSSGVTGAGSGFGYDGGIGLRYNVSNNFDVRLKGEYLKIGSNAGYTINEGDITLGAAYHF